MDTPRPCSPLARMEFQAFEKIMPAAASTDNENFTELNGSQSGPRTSISVHTLDILSVKELLEPVRRALPVSSFLFRHLTAWCMEMSFLGCISFPFYAV
ncbi:hypothetical protein Peur_063487 [Populus x canadensis]